MLGIKNIILFNLPVLVFSNNVENTYEVMTVSNLLDNT